MKILNILRGISGEFEINRVVGAFGATVFIVTVPAFEAWNMAKGRPFDVTAYCVAFPAGIAAAVGAIAAAVRWKDKGVEEAKIIRDTGAVPGVAPTSVETKP